MPPEGMDAGFPHDWLRHAQSDLALAQMRKTRRVLYEHLCFHAQQAAEKAIKAVLIVYGVRLPRTHDLAFLVAQLPPRVVVPLSFVDLPILTKYAVQQRYPGESPALTPGHRRRAVGLAQEAVAWAATRIAHAAKGK